MRNKLPFLILILAATLVSSQMKNDPAGPDLTKLTIKQLVGCLDYAEICKTEDNAAITAELDRRIPSYPTGLLLTCFGDWKACGSNEFTIAEELAHRRKIASLMDRYWQEPNAKIREGILLTATRFRSATVADFMRKALAAKRGDEEELFWAADYLAAECDPDALEWLSTRKGRLAGCMWYIDITADFGKCNFRRAVPYIVDYSIRDACLGIDDEGVKDLLRFFPHSRKHFDSMEEMQDYFCGRAKQEGLKVECNTK